MYRLLRLSAKGPHKFFFASKVAFKAEITQTHLIEKTMPSTEVMPLTRLRSRRLLLYVYGWKSCLKMPCFFYKNHNLNKHTLLGLTLHANFFVMHSFFSLKMDLFFGFFIVSRCALTGFKFLGCKYREEIYSRNNYNLFVGINNKNAFHYIRYHSTSRAIEIHNTIEFLFKCFCKQFHFRTNTESLNLC